MLIKDKIVKLEVCTLRNSVLLTVTKNYSFPNKTGGEDGAGEGETVIIKGKNLPVLAPGAFVNTMIYAKSGESVKYSGRIADSTETQLNISVWDDSKKTNDRRRFYKVSAELPCVISSVTRGDNHLELEPPLTSAIQDINVGGVFIKANDKAEFKKEDVLAVVLEDVTGGVEFIVKILRVQNSPEGKTTGYGCCFLFLNSGQEEVVAKFINKLQIEQRALEREAGLEN